MLIQIVSGQNQVAEFRASTDVAVGRQSLEKGDPLPFQLLPPKGGEPSRLIVAPSHEQNCSRRALLLEPVSKDRVRVRNTSQTPFEVRTDRREVLEAGAAVEYPIPIDLGFVGFVLRVAEEDWEQLGVATLPPSSSAVRSSPLPMLPTLSTDHLDDLVRWMQTTTAVFQSTLSTSEFIPASAAALVDIVGLDGGRVLLLKGGEWQQAAHYPLGTRPLPVSRTVLERVRADRRTYWKKDDGTAEAQSVIGRLSMVVAAPILDSAGEMVGILYGDRAVRPGPQSRQIGKPEALLVEMLACGIATGLARQAHQDKAVLAESRFARFFTKELAAELERDPSLLEGREADVSLLFADVRGFSRISERLGAVETVRWIGDVMTELSRDIIDTRGLLMDYIGDELIAMWGAPASQPDHATRAVETGLAMLKTLPRLTQRWKETIGEACMVGIGINSGPAMVGNTGAEMKFKYGALGGTVNLASRVQGLTKYLKRPFLITGSTRGRLDSRFIARRICRTRVVNIETPVELFEVERAGAPDRRQFFADSEAALTALEAERFAESATMAGRLLGSHRGDGPLQLILARASEMLMRDGENFDPVWLPPGK